MVSQLHVFADPFLQIWSFVTNKNLLSLNYFFTRNSFLSTSATLSSTFCNTLIIHVCNKSIILLPHGFAVESWNLYCTKLIIMIYRTGPMSIIISCSLSPSRFQPHIKFPPMNNFLHQLKPLILKAPSTARVSTLSQLACVITF